MQTFSDQISTMLKSLSDTMLAAIGVALASFIGALFRDKFDPNIFRIGLITYGFYVMIFPLIYNMWYESRYFKTLIRNFARRKKRFEQLLDVSKVKEIVKKPLKVSIKRFGFWFRIIRITYIGIVLVAFIAAWAVPSYIN